MRSSAPRRIAALLVAAALVSALVWVLAQQGESPTDVATPSASRRDAPDGLPPTFSAPISAKAERPPVVLPDPDSSAAAQPASLAALLVRGLIVDDAGAPIRGARVRLLDAAHPDAPAEGASSDERGAFQLVAPRAGRFDLVAQAAGHVDGMAADLELSMDIAAPPQTLTLPRLGAIRAAFFDRHGNIVGDAALAAARRLPEGDSGLQHVRDFTDTRPTNPYRIRVAAPDELGTCLLADVEPGVYAVWMSGGRHDLVLAMQWTVDPPRSGEPELFAILDVRPGETAGISFRLPDPATIGGVVTDGGAPAPNALMALFDDSSEGSYDDAARASLLLARTTTDEHGRYEFSRLMPGGYCVYAMVPGTFMPVFAIVDVKEGQQLTQDIAIDGVTLHGIVKDGFTDEPLSDMVVRVDMEPLSIPKPQSKFPPAWGQDLEAICPDFPLRAATDAAGRFTIRALPLSSRETTYHWLEVTGSGYAPAGRQFAFKRDGAREMDVVITVVPGAIIDGTLASGSPAVDLVVRLEGPWITIRKPEFTAWDWVKAGEEPHVHFASLRGGLYTLTVFDARGAAHGTLDVRVETGEHAEVVVPTDL